MNQCLDLPQSIRPLSTRFFVGEFIMVDTNRIIKGPNLDFGEFLRFISIWISITENPCTNWSEYFSKNPIYFSVGAQFVSTISCLELVLKVSDLISSLLPPSPLTFEINDMKSDI